MIDKGLLLAARLPRRQITIAGVGDITIRALSRQEMLDLGADKGQSPMVFERRELALALVDPKLTVDEVAEWQQTSPVGEIQEVMQAINELSGIGEDALKEAYKSLREKR